MDSESGLRVVRGQKFADCRVDLDGVEFVDCQLDRCHLVYNGGDPFLFDNTPVDGCRMSLDGAAERTVIALSVMYHFGMADHVEALFQHIRIAARKHMN